jgi:hypothetical protein
MSPTGPRAAARLEVRESSQAPTDSPQAWRSTTCPVAISMSSCPTSTCCLCWYLLLRGLRLGGHGDLGCGKRRRLRSVVEGRSSRCSTSFEATPGPEIESLARSARQAWEASEGSRRTNEGLLARRSTPAEPLSSIYLIAHHVCPCVVLLELCRGGRRRLDLGLRSRVRRCPGRALTRLRFAPTLLSAAQNKPVKVGVIGGSGLYKLDNLTFVSVMSCFGALGSSIG